MNAGELWELQLEDVDGFPVHRVVLLTLGDAPDDRAYGKRHLLARCLVLDSSAPSAWVVGSIGDWFASDLVEGEMARRIA